MKKNLSLVFVTCFLFALHSPAQTPAKTDSIISFSIADSSIFTGKYRYEGLPFDYMTISVQNGALYYSGGEYSGGLNPVTGKQDVFDANGNATFTFLRDTTNKVTDLKIDYQGQSYMGKKDQEEK